MGSGPSKSKDAGLQGAPSVVKGFRREITTVNPEPVTEKALEQETSNKLTQAPAIQAPATQASQGEVDDKDFVKVAYGKCSAKWPIRCYGKLDVNVNCHHGGAAALYFVSCSYGGKGQETNAELLLVRNGFDCNYVALKSIYKDHEGHFGCSNGACTDEEGTFIGDCLFGNNHLLYLSNDNRHGNLRCGVYVQSGSGSSKVQLPLNINTSGLSLLLCSSLDSGTLVNAAVMIRSGFKDNQYKAKVLSGDDKYKFSVDGSGMLSVEGPGDENKYSLFHNKDDLTERPGLALVSQTQSVSGSERTILLDSVTRHATLMVICSSSNGPEDSTAAAVYYLSLVDGNLTVSTFLSGNHGSSYKSADLWQFSMGSGQLIVVGPDGPCKYGILSNMKAEKSELLSLVRQSTCLGTGEEVKTTGKVKVTVDGVSGEVNKPTDLCVMFNSRTIRRIAAAELQKAGGVYKFSCEFGAEEKVVGYHIVRVLAARKHTTTGEEVLLELPGSPYRLTRQKPGVVYALNCAGPAYQAVNDVVYASEHAQFANFTKEYVFGTQSRALGKVYHIANMAEMMLNTQDGFMQVSNRSSGVEADDEKKITYKVDNIANGNYHLRVHFQSVPGTLKFNGKEITGELKKVIESRKRQKLDGPTSHTADVDVTVGDGSFHLTINREAGMIAGFALLDPKTYEEKAKSPSQFAEEEQQKARIADTTPPLNVNATKKKITIVGWSQNLLNNASGQEGSMKYWNTSGDIKTAEGGSGTNTSFVTSHMWCEKNQEIDLLEHFSAQYLDTAPVLQVSEMYLQGCIGGGFYDFTAKLMDENGKAMETFHLGQQGTIYNDKWLEVSHTFSNYGPGLRMVAFSSKGKDDKHWGGHYGVRMSNAQVRVKRETKAAEGDAFEDLQVERVSESNSLDKLITNLLIENDALLQTMSVEEDNIVTEKAIEKQLGKFKRPTISRPAMNKKREIRVFVSSTFRDFTKEREEIIKKAFREINKICSERGVFFTYVDLRWGITSEQTGDGKTISICLQEIDRCRPYFICLMGDRFGWCQQEEKPDSVLNMTYDYALENNPNLAWIEQYRFDSSVTQLEIYHGVLNNPTAVKNRSFFYLRNPPVEEELSEDDYKRRVSESAWHHERVTWLKSQVTSHSELNIKNFKGADEVADMIKQDLTACVNDDFPMGTELTKLEQQRAAHYAFASVRCRVYIGRDEYFTQINNRRAENIAQPFVLLGESGGGKSALVANWCKRVEDAEPDTFMFVHFIGSSSDSADYMKLLRRLFEELKFFYTLDLQIPSSDTLLINELPKWLRVAGSRSKVVIVLDALNQLDDGTGKDGTEHDLLWIPSELPPNVFMLLSTLPGRTLTAVETFGWPSMPVKPLQEGDKQQIITDYLEGIYGKTLNAEQKQLLVNAPQTSNPLFLKSLLDEVRMYGSFRTLTAKIEEYLTALRPSELFAKILERLEADFEEGTNSRKGLVHDATTALWCSNKGMSEAELVELLEVPSAVWSPFYLSLFENLVNRDGLLNFFHDHLRQAVENKYLSTEEAKKQGYLRLANYFSTRDTSDRTVEELPFLLTHAGEMGRLQEYISDIEVFRRLNKSEDGYFELVKSWKSLGGFSLVEEAYLGKVESLSQEEMSQNFDYYRDVFSKLGDFFRNLGLIESAKKIYKALIQQLEITYRESHGTIVYNFRNQSRKYKCKHPDVIKALQALGQVYMQQLELDKAVKVYQDAITRQNRIETPAQQLQLCEGLLGLATTYIQKSDMVSAKKLMTRALELAVDLLGRRHHFVASIYSLIGQLSYSQSRLDEALMFCLVDLRTTRSEFGTSHPTIATVLNEIALVYDDKNDTKAGALYEAALSIILETYGRNYLGTGVIRYNLGTFYFGTNYFSRARYQLEESYKIHVNFLGDDHLDTKAVKTALEEVKAMTC